MTVKFVKFTDFYLSIKYYNSFLNYFMFVANLIKNSNAAVQNLMKMNFKLNVRSNLSRVPSSKIRTLESVQTYLVDELTY